MSYILEHHKIACDPFGSGLSNEVQLGLASWLTHGMRFALPLGAIVLFRRRLYPDVGRWVVCGIARPDASTISNWSGFGHEAEMSFQYATARALGNGFISPLSEPTRVDFDKIGDLIIPRLPMFPIAVVAQAVAGGKFRITWTYDGFGEGTQPSEFRVSEGATPETVNYSSFVVDTVTGLSAFPFLGNGARHVLNATGAYDDGSEHVFAVRGKPAGGVLEQNVYTTDTVRARASTPTGATAVSARMRRI